MVNALFLENWTVTSYTATDETLTIEARYDLDPPSCPKCGVVGARLYKHGPAEVEYVEAPAYGMRCTIKVQTKRLKCLECGKTFMQPLPDMADGYLMTKRCLRYIEREVVNETFAKVARTVGVNDKTVRSIAKEAMARWEAERRVYAPLILGIDELRLHGDLRTIFVDGAYRRVLDILPSQDKRLVNHWLSWLPDRQRVRIVTMDMYGPYRDVVSHLMPDALIIVDRWHVQKALNKALDTVRVRVSRAQRTKKAKQDALKKRKLLQSSRKRLRPHTLALLEAWLAQYPVLKDAWEAKEAFYDVWESKSCLEAETAFLKVRDALPDSVKEEFGEKGFSGTIWRWWEHVFPFFEFRYTNAYTEAANGLIKQLNRAGRGYKFEQIRAKALAYKRLSGEFLWTCEECLKRFPTTDGMFFHLGLAVCPECVQSHTDALLADQGHSTPISG